MASPQGRAFGLFTVDRDRLSLRSGAIGVLAILGAVVVLAVIGDAGAAAVAGAAISAASAGRAPLGTRIARGLAAAVVGSLLTAAGVWSGGDGWTTGLVVALVTFAATLAVAYGKAAATAGFLLNLWFILALSFTAADHSLGALAGSFLAGGVLAVLLQPLAARREAPGATGRRDEHHGARGAHGGWSAPVRAALRLDSPVLQFAVTRALGAGLATLLGWYLFDAHPYWAVLVTLIIIKSDPAESLIVGVHRTVGTVAGVVAGGAIAHGIESRPVLAILLLVVAMLMVLFMSANYALFTFFLTATLLLTTRLVEKDVSETASERAWATLLGVGIAFAVIAFVTLLVRRQSSRPPTPAAG